MRKKLVKTITERHSCYKVGRPEQEQLARLEKQLIENQAIIDGHNQLIQTLTQAFRRQQQEFEQLRLQKRSLQDQLLKIQSGKVSQIQKTKPLQPSQAKLVTDPATSQQKQLTGFYQGLLQENQALKFEIAVLKQRLLQLEKGQTQPSVQTCKLQRPQSPFQYTSAVSVSQEVTLVVTPAVSSVSVTPQVSVNLVTQGLSANPAAPDQPANQAAQNLTLQEWRQAYCSLKQKYENQLRQANQTRIKECSVLLSQKEQLKFKLGKMHEAIECARRQAAAAKKQNSLTESNLIKAQNDLKMKGQQILRLGIELQAQKGKVEHKLKLRNEELATVALQADRGKQKNAIYEVRLQEKCRLIETLTKQVQFLKLQIGKLDQNRKSQIKNGKKDRQGKVKKIFEQIELRERKSQPLLKCLQCGERLKDPVTAVPCGHLFCCGCKKGYAEECAKCGVSVHFVLKNEHAAELLKLSAVLASAKQVMTKLVSL